MIRGTRWLPAALVFAKQAGEYCQEHERLLGKYGNGRPPQPSTRVLKELNCTFQEWLEMKGLRALIPFFTYSQSAQGYGTLEEVPALYGLWWNTPRFLSRALNVDPITLLMARLLLPMLRMSWLCNLSFPALAYMCHACWMAFQMLWALMQALGLVRPRPPSHTVLRCGYQKLWTSMAKELDVFYECPVTFIDRSGGSAVVTYKSAGKECQLEADLVVVCPSILPFLCSCSHTNPFACIW